MTQLDAPLDRLSDNVAAMKESATIAVSTRARALRAAGREIIDLGCGEPDFDTPAFICRAAEAAIAGGETRYTPVAGIPPLRRALADRATGVAGHTVDPSEIVVSTGSKQSLFNACFTLFGPGDEVLVPTPAWTSYYEMIGLARATAVPVLGDPANGFKVSVDALRDAATDRSAGIILNSPCNPTGAVYSARELSAILELAHERGWWVISDEIYRRICYEGAGVAPSALELAPSRDRLVVVDGVAKAYAMTGWRIGWAIAPRTVAGAMTGLQSHTTSNASSISQHAALAAVTRIGEADASIAAMVGEFRRRRDAALRLLGAPGAPRALAPGGAFYLYLDVGGMRGGSEHAGTAFARELLDQQGVAVVPGIAFLTPDWIRVSYATSLELVEEGMRRIIRMAQAG